jgi:hypothetical protein
MVKSSLLGACVSPCAVTSLLGSFLYVCFSMRIGCDIIVARIRVRSKQCVVRWGSLLYAGMQSLEPADPLSGVMSNLARGSQGRPLQLVDGGIGP